LRNDDTVETFIKRADEAMYKAKKDGKNKVVLAS
jgi:PleD family two-component response regulator